MELEQFKAIFRAADARVEMETSCMARVLLQYEPKDSRRAKKIKKHWKAMDKIYAVTQYNAAHEALQLVEGLQRDADIIRAKQAYKHIFQAIDRQRVSVLENSGRAHIPDISVPDLLYCGYIRKLRTGP